MYHLELIKALSYTGVVSATKEKPDVYTDDEATAKEAVASGYFELVEEPSGTPVDPEDPEDPETQAEYSGKTLDQMNKSELETFATYRDVDIKGAKTKADIIAKLREVLDPAELEGEISYGSPTMQELQKE